ncbi:hypothetical protein CYY_007316 [Polysphondylium violaceum]|uniref:RNA helicase n=1 Tax=Polysphondylium violaceum TaxID=133409 RepID=A0A8J4PQZ6_9MYCE|nr:hypothetical protein CYY_007316 [Polysphondylium violaceum]
MLRYFIDKTYQFKLNTLNNNAVFSSLSSLNNRFYVKTTTNHKDNISTLGKREKINRDGLDKKGKSQHLRNNKSISNTPFKVGESKKHEGNRTRYFNSLYGNKELASTEGFKKNVKSYNQTTTTTKSRSATNTKQESRSTEKLDKRIVFNQLDDKTLQILSSNKDNDGLVPELNKFGTGQAFSRLGLVSPLVKALRQEFTISIPSSIQQLAIPEILKSHKDVLFCSQTGTGKTLAYLLPIIQNLKKQDILDYQDSLKDEQAKLKDKEIKKSMKNKELLEDLESNKELDKQNEDNEQEEEEEDFDNIKEEEEEVNELTNKKELPGRPKAIILLPTRELAHQVMKVAKKLSHEGRFSCTAVCSGAGDFPKLRKTYKNEAIDLLVTTPGTLNKLIKSKKIFFGQLKYIVVDEADSMFTSGKGFNEELPSILEPIKYRLQHKDEPGLKPIHGIVCSATLTDQLVNSINGLFPNITKLSTKAIHKSVNSLEQRFIKVTGGGDKHDSLRKAINYKPNAKTLIFCNNPASCRSTQYFLEENGFKATSMHAELPLVRRAKHWKSFLQGDSQFLVCTDIISRGIDIGNVEHVVIFDFPSNPIDYLHRIGRTARAGNKGLVTCLIVKKDEVLAHAIQNSIQKGFTLESLSSNKRLNKNLNHHQSDLNHYLHFVLIIDVAGESCDSKVVGIAYELVLINNKKMVDFKPKWIQVDRKGVDLKILID